MTPFAAAMCGVLSYGALMFLGTWFSFYRGGFGDDGPYRVGYGPFCYGLAVVSFFTVPILLMVIGRR